MSRQGKSCWESHPELKLHGGTFIGGSAFFVPAGVQVAVALDSGANRGPYPWEGTTKVLYPIMDRSVPADPANFKAMVDWLMGRLQVGDRVHVGCMGGHGRTGLVLAALVAVGGVKDAIQWVRKHYCPRAVESTKQVAFLVANFGCSQAPARDLIPPPPKMPGLLPAAAGTAPVSPAPKFLQEVRPLGMDKRIW